MIYENSIRVLDGGSVMARCGPMHLVISSYLDRVDRKEMNLEAARVSFGYFERVAGLQDVLRQRHDRLPHGLEDPLAMTMIRSVLAVGDKDLKPMAAVAGTIADAVADFLSQCGVGKVVVNNGGDIAIRLRRGESAIVGIRTDLNRRDIEHMISLDSSRPSWGVATSGLGGRSLTRGIASAATVVASTGSLADAAATAIANASFASDPQIIQRPAEEVDPHTDIRSIRVTVRVGPISPEKKNEAISKAIARAEELVDRGVIWGALVAVEGRLGMTSFIRERLVEYQHLERADRS
jgi:uncharacterized protein